MAETAPFDCTYSEVYIPDEVPAGGEHELEFTDLGDGRTRLETTEHDCTSADVRDLSRDGLDRCFDTMAVLVEGGR